MEDKYNIKQMIIFIIVILLVLGIFYGITLLVTKNKNSETTDNSETNEEAVIDYDTILVSNILKQKEQSYYVFAYQNDNEKLSDYNNDLVQYKSKEDALKVYYVDLDSAFNKNYVFSDENPENDLIEYEYPTFRETTLLKIEDGLIAEKYVGEEEITNALSTLKGE